MGFRYQKKKNLFQTYQTRGTDGLKFIFVFCLGSAISLFSQNQTKEDEIGKLIVGPIPGFVNTDRQEFSPTFSPDGLELYFYSKMAGETFTDIFRSRRQPDESWGKPEKVPEVNSDFDDQSPFLTGDGRFLYFSSNRDGSIETRLSNGSVGVSRDIYVSEKKGKIWSRPIALPREINSDMIEENPHFLNNSLLFTRYPFGRPDLAKIFISEYKNGNWTPAKALPQPINDGYATIAAGFSHDQKTIFFSSNRPGGFGGFDLYSLDWKNGSPGGEIQNLGPEFNTESDEAYFSYHKESKTILFCRRLEGKQFDIYSAYIPRSIFDRLAEDKKISLDSIQFELASFQLLPESIKTLNQVADYLKKNPGIRMKIIGHTDLNGNLGDNMVLSENRAKAVRDYLVTKGISFDRLETEGKGSTQPLFDSREEEASRRNRRTEFQLLN